MIHAFIIYNNLGKIRLAKFYDDINFEKKQSLLKKIFPAINKIDEKSCNFFSDPGLYNPKTKVIVRQYATLYFVMIIDGDESELAILDLIQIIVEALDNIFENACELDLIYHPEKVNSLIDQVVIGGIVIETSLVEIIDSIKTLSNYEKKKGF